MASPTATTCTTFIGLLLRSFAPLSQSPSHVRTPTRLCTFPAAQCFCGPFTLYSATSATENSPPCYSPQFCSCVLRERELAHSLPVSWCSIPRHSSAFNKAGSILL